MIPQADIYSSLFFLALFWIQLNMLSTILQQDHKIGNVFLHLSWNVCYFMYLYHLSAYMFLKARAFRWTCANWFKTVVIQLVYMYLMYKYIWFLLIHTVSHIGRWQGRIYKAMWYKILKQILAFSLWVLNHYLHFHTSEAWKREQEK